MKFKSEVLTQASGSIGGTTYGHNRGGLYRRARSIPVNPNSAAQQAARNALSQLASAWNTVLSAAQRDAWRTYAENTQVTDVFGDPLTLTGQQMYIRCNQPRLRAGATRVDDGPTTFGTAPLGDLALGGVGAASPGIVTLTWSGSPDWESEDDAHVIVQASRSVSLATNFFKGPFRLAGTIDGDSTTAPTSPDTVTSAFAATALSRVFVRVVISRADGRLSPVLTDSAVVV